MMDLTKLCVVHVGMFANRFIHVYLLIHNQNSLSPSLWLSCGIEFYLSPSQTAAAVHIDIA